MKACLKQYIKIYKITELNKLFAVIILLGIVTGSIYLIFSNEADVLSMTMLISFGIMFFVVSILGSSQFKHNNYLSIFPIKSDIRLKSMFFTGEKAIIIFYSVVMLMSLFKADFKIILLEANLMILMINFCYLVTDGTDPKKQEFKLSFVFIIFLFGFFGGVISALIHNIVKSNGDTLTLIIMVMVLCALTVLSLINKHYSYKKFIKNITCLNNN